MSYLPQHETALTTITSAACYMPSNSITTENDVCNDEAAKMSLAGISEQTRLFNGKQLSDPISGAHARLGSTSEAPGDSDVDHELAGLNALEDGLPGERPAYPFTTLIRYAIKGSPRGRLLLEEIYQAIQSRYPFFTTAPAGWKNSVRHTLSLMTCFEKVPRLLTEPGKGSYWTVNDSMPHAKPSRVRVRKRKIRLDDDDSSLDTSIPTPDTFPPETTCEDTFVNRGNHGVSGWSEALPRRHSPHLQSSLNNQQLAYSRNSEYCGYDDSVGYYGNENTYAHEYQMRSRPALESRSHSVGSSHSDAHWGERASDAESDGALANTLSSYEGSSSADSIDHRLVLMSELEKLRNVIGRRQDIDREWCRLMVERLRGTGLDF